MTSVSPRIERKETKLTDAQRAFLEHPFVGVVTDLRPDGSPHSTVVWVDVDDDGVSFNTAWPRAKPRYLERDPRVSLTVLDPADPYRWVSISGTATFVDEGANGQLVPDATRDVRVGVHDGDVGPSGGEGGQGR